VRGPAAAALLPLLLAATPDEKPFPATDRSLILREEKTTYLVAGRIVIPKGVEISCQKDIFIKATGTTPAVIVVEGSFKAHGVGAREIIFEGVTVEPGPEFDEIQLDMCIFRKGGGLATPKDGAARGRILLQNVRFREDARVDLALSAESFQFLDSDCSGSLRLRGAPGKDGLNRLKAVVRAADCGGMEAIGVADLTVRINTFRALPLVFRDCAALQFDGNKVEAREIRFEQTKAGGFARTQVMKCDLYAKTIAFHSPADPKRDDVVVLDKCWFEGVTDAKAIAERIRDAADDPANNVRAKVLNPQERPLELAGSVNR
jgi:hypothetical protein